MEMHNIYLLLLVTLFLPAYVNSFWGSDTTTTKPIVEYDLAQCPLRVCKWGPNATFSCSQAACARIPTNLTQSVENIILNNNRIEIVPKLNYSKLMVLDLSSNRINKIVDYAFEDCDELLTLHLDHNNLSTINENIFFGLTKLKYLYLQSNQFTKITSDLYSLHSLERLDFSMNQISEIETNALALSTIKYMHLQQNKITDIDDHLWNLKQLKYLELMQNNIKKIKSNAFQGCGNLEHLDLNFNNISELEEFAFLGLDKLKRLEIEHNLFQTVSPGIFSDLYSLEELYLGYNYFEEIPDDFLPKESLIKLFITHNHQLKVIKNGTFSDMSNLNEVYISNCPHLKTIEPNAFGDDPIIEVLDLSYNSLQTLHEDLVDWRSLVYLDLSGNPWDCDCHLEWMIEVPMQKVARDSIRCETPLSVRGEVVGHMDFTKFRCDAGSLLTWQHVLAVGLVLFFTFLLIAGLILFIVKCREKVCPCCYHTVVGKYRAMYNTVQEDEEGDPSMDIQFEKKPSRYDDDPDDGVTV